MQSDQILKILSPSELLEHRGLCPQTVIKQNKYNNNNNKNHLYIAQVAFVVVLS